MWLALLVPLTLAIAQIELDPERDVSLVATVEPLPVPAGGSGVLTLAINLPSDCHITSRDYEFFFVAMDSVPGIEWGIPSYPSGVTFDGETVYQGVVKVSVPLMIARSIGSEKTLMLPGTVGYQICTEKEPVYCTPPIERRFEATLITGDPGSGGGLSTGAASGGLTLEEKAKRALESGSAVALLWIFVGGLLLSFTPCVYPVIPITIVYIGARSGTNKMRALTLALVFVLGLALVYSLLGLFAAATGGVFGLSTQNPWVLAFITAVFVVMGIGMLGAFDINLPSSWQTALASKKRSGYLGALFVGGTTGLVAAPCVGPVLVALLSWVASTGSLGLGFFYLFVFAVGLGFPFILIGTFAGVLTALPRAGVWMERVKQVFGVILIAAAYYFVRPQVPGDWFVLAVGFGLLVLAGLMGAFGRLGEEASLAHKAGRATALFVLVTGIFYTLVGLSRLEGVSLTGGASAPVAAGASSGSSLKAEPAHGFWQMNDIDGALSDAKTSGRRVLVDFWADWCAACKELDHKTWNVPEVDAYVRANLHPVKVDGTKITAEVKAVWAKYGVRGLPTVLVLAPDGTELARFEAFRTAEQVMPVLQSGANKSASGI